MGVSEKITTLPGFVDFRIFNPDEVPLTLDTVQRIIAARLQNNEDSINRLMFKLPEVASLSEFDIIRPYSIYRFFGEEFGKSLNTNINKNGLKEGDMFGMNTVKFVTNKEDQRVRVIDKRVYGLVVSREIAKSIAQIATTKKVSICSSAHGRSALLIISPK